MIAEISAGIKRIFKLFLLEQKIVSPLYDAIPNTGNLTLFLLFK